MSMGVYINMEMPKSCSDCPLCYDMMECSASDIRFFKVKEQVFHFRTERHPNCPLVPVPPHGDLIDRDEMRETIKPWSPEDEMTGCTFDTVKKLMHTMISRAPVVIPAEEGE